MNRGHAVARWYALREAAEILGLSAGALRKLLEAKDAAVRAAIYREPVES